MAARFALLLLSARAGVFSGHVAAIMKGINMKSFRRAGSCSLLLLLALALLGTAATSQAQQNAKRRPGTVLYQLKDGATAADKAAVERILSSHGLRLDRQLRDGRSQRVRTPAANVSEETMAQRLQASGAVAWAEPDYVAQALATPNDPNFSQQWWLTNIRAPAAWDITTGSTNIIVAVCDTGVQSAHPDLAAQLILPGYNTYLNNTNSEDTVGHGTMVAGCIGAIGNNGQGVAGMAWKVRILPIRITYADGVGSAYVSDMAEGLTYAADRGAKVINCSFSGFNASAIEAAAKYARGKGALVCFAAGNSGVNMTTGYPDTTNIVVVGATTSSETLTSWSNYGKPIDVVAPGLNIMTTTMGSGYATVSGTSFSSPIVAGLAALVYSVNPNFTPDDVEQIIKSTAKDLGAAGKDNTFGYGLVQADLAVALAGFGVLAPSALTATISNTNNVVLRWTDNSNNEIGFSVERATVSNGITGAYTVIATVLSNVVTCTDTNLAAGTYAYRVQAFSADTPSAYSGVVSVTIKQVAPTPTPQPKPTPTPTPKPAPTPKPTPHPTPKPPPWFWKFINNYWTW